LVVLVLFSPSPSPHGANARKKSEQKRKEGNNKPERAKEGSKGSKGAADEELVVTTAKVGRVHKQ
jgi:hypothetical protein